MSARDKIEVMSIKDFETADEVKINRITDKTGTQDLGVSIVSFPPGTKRPWSSHSRDQYLLVLDGQGIVASERDTFVVERGMLIFIPAGLNHQHGAAKGSRFIQLSIIGGKPPTNRNCTCSGKDS